MKQFEILNHYCQEHGMFLKMEFDYSKCLGRIIVEEASDSGAETYTKDGICLETTAKLMLSEIKTMSVLIKKSQDEAKCILSLLK